MPKLSNKRNNRKDVILNSAAILFKAKGYAATSMRDLAEEVGIEAASLYNHISGKAQILEEIIQELREIEITQQPIKPGFFSKFGNFLSKTPAVVSTLGQVLVAYITKAPPSA